jgi:transcriptional regulator with XRE-family HTH domain
MPAPIAKTPIRACATGPTVGNRQIRAGCNTAADMGSRKRRAARTIGAHEANAIAANLGRDLRRTRTRRRLTQAELGDKVGVSQAEVSALEAGRGAHTPIETWVALGIALDRPIAIGFSRDIADPLPQDAGHLAAQELVLRLTTAAGWRGRFEAPSDPLDPRYSTDLALIAPDDRIALIEIWNRLDDLGRAVRSSDRKLAEVSRPGTVVGSCWLLVDTAANREIVRRYPSIIRARFAGSSHGWVAALTRGSTPPRRPGIAWIDVRSARIRELRLPAG